MKSEKIGKFFNRYTVKVFEEYSFGKKSRYLTHKK